MNKIIVTSIALALAATAAEARDIAAGTMMVTGDTKIDISSNEISASGQSTTIDTTEINLTGAYFVAPNFGVGLLLASEMTEEDDGTSVVKQTMNMVGPIVGYNMSLSPVTSLMINGAIFTIHGEMDAGVSSADIDGTGYMLGASINFFLNDYVATNVGLRVVDADIDLTGGGQTMSADMTETGVGVGLSVYF